MKKSNFIDYTDCIKLNYNNFDINPEFDWVMRYMGINYEDIIDDLILRKEDLKKEETAKLLKKSK